MDTQRETTNGRANLASVDTRAAIPETGTRIDQYTVGRFLGTGGMGLVLEARDRTLERDVALKLVHPELLTLPNVQESFLQEARAMAAITHPNVVSIYAFGGHEGRPYFAMELVDGPTLEARLYASAPQDMNHRQKLGILSDVAAGLDAIHASGRIHGDVKAENVLLAADGRAVLSDMGLSEAVGTLTNRAVRGTPAYIAPERAARTVPVRSLAPRQDVYSFAVLACELLTGRLPFELAAGEPIEKLLGMHVHRTPPRPSELDDGVPMGIDEPILRSLDKDPRARHESASALVADLRRVLAHSVPAPAFRVLIADDDPDLRSLLSEGLIRAFEGSVVEAACDGSSALAAAQTNPPHVVIADLNMPGLNGIELTAALRDLAPREELGIVVITGEGGPADWRLLRRLGADRFFVKPAPLDALCDALRPWLPDAKFRPSDPPPSVG